MKATLEDSEGEQKDPQETKAFRRLKSNLTTNLVWIYILRLLQGSGPCYGYELKRRLKEEYDIPLATVTSYVVLYKLEAEGLVRSIKTEEKPEKPARGRPTRKYYRITDLGENLLENAKHFIQSTYQNVFAEEMQL